MDANRRRVRRSRGCFLVGINHRRQRPSSYDRRRQFTACVGNRCALSTSTKSSPGSMWPSTSMNRSAALPRSSIQWYQPSPKGLSGRPGHRPFRGLLGVHSGYSLPTRAGTVFRDALNRKLHTFRLLHASRVASGWSGCPVGLAPTGKRRLITAHTQGGYSAFPSADVVYCHT